MSIDQTHIHSLNTDFAQEWMAVCSTEDTNMNARQLELYQDYLDDCATVEGIRDALGSTTNIVDNQTPALLLAVMAGDFAKAREIAADICAEAATNYAETVYEREQRDPGELADEEMERRKDRERDDFDFYDRRAA